MPFLKKQSGEGLVEVLIGLAISVLVLGALVMVVVKGLNDAQFAQNQALATKLAQDSMEKIRTARDQSADVDFLNDPTISFREFIRTYNSSDNQCVGSGNLCYFKVDETPDLQLTEVEDDEKDQIISDTLPGFKREIVIRHQGGNFNEKLVIVKVKWFDSAGEHQSYLETILTDSQ